MMLGPLYLGWKYVSHHRWKAALLVAAIGLIAFLPPALVMVVERGAENLRARAAATPLLLGAPGSQLELTLNSLYFNESTPAAVARDQALAVDPSLARTIPVYARYRSRGFPIVGTSTDYLSYRGLPIADGRPFARLGESVIGARVAQALNVGVGDHVISSPESLFDLAGVYPLKMDVVGVLAPTATPDDDAVFTDLKTSWVIEGLGHGHQDLSEARSPDLVLSREAGTVTANAALVQFNEITDENRDSFHFHGDGGQYPVTGFLVIPKDDKSSAILQGRFLETEATQLVRPAAVIDSLLETVFTVQAFVLLVVGLVAGATLLVAGLVLLLSLRLRGREFLTLRRMGAARGSILVLMGSETGFVLLSSLLVAGGLLMAVRLVGTTELVLWLAG